MRKNGISNWYLPTKSLNLCNLSRVTGDYQMRFTRATRKDRRGRRGSCHQQYIKEEILIPLGLKNTFGSLSEVNIDSVMSGYYVGFEQDFKTVDTGLMLATAEDVGKFLRALNNGSVFNEGEKEIYSSIYKYEHTGLIPGYQSIAKYYKDIDTVVIQFNNTTNFDGYNWSLAEIFYKRIVKIVRSG